MKKLSRASHVTPWYYWRFYPLANYSGTRENHPACYCVSPARVTLHTRRVFGPRALGHPAVRRVPGGYAGSRRERGNRVLASSGRKYSRVPEYFFPKVGGYPSETSTRQDTSRVLMNLPILPCCDAPTSSHTAPVCSSLLIADRRKLPYIAWRALLQYDRNDPLMTVFC